MSAQSKFFTALTIAACLAAPALSHADVVAGGVVSQSAAVGSATLTAATATSVLVVTAVSVAHANKSTGTN